MVESNKPRVLVTGITGFLGSWVCKLFLEDGSYQVVGTVRDKTNEKKLAPVKKAYGDLYEQLELVEADLTKPQTIIDACKGCTYVVHTASPFPLENPKNEDQLIKPAVEGTKAALDGCKLHGVKRLVITSSCAAIQPHLPANEKPIYTEEDWADLGACDAYYKSKTLAERAAWDFQKELPEGEKFDIVTINPSFIQGPALVQGDFSSAKLQIDLLSGKVPAMPRIHFAYVDVRDVALMHLKAIQVPEAANHRFIASSGDSWLKDYVATIRANVGDGYKLPKKELKYCLAKTLSLFNAQACQMVKIWNKEFKVDNTKSKQILGIQYIPIEDAINAMTNSIIEAGMIEDKRKK